MPAPENNLNAEKWTEDRVIALMSILCEKSTKTRQYTLFGAVEPDISLDQYEYLCVKYVNNPVVSQSLKSLKATIERNITEDALSGKVKETMSIFLLKCKFGLQDKQVIELDNKGSVNVNFNFPQPDIADQPDM